jgi:hypothetical protein
MMAENKIVQILPATPGWRWARSTKHCPEDVAAWAVVEDGKIYPLVMGGNGGELEIPETIWDEHDTGPGGGTLLSPSGSWEYFVEPVNSEHIGMRREPDCEDAHNCEWELIHAGAQVLVWRRSFFG